MSAMTRMIKDFCKRTGSDFVGYKDGFYEFKLITGSKKSLTQSELIKIVRNF